MFDNYDAYVNDVGWWTKGSIDNQDIWSCAQSKVITTNEEHYPPAHDHDKSR